LLKKCAFVHGVWGKPPLIFTKCFVSKCENPSEGAQQFSTKSAAAPPLRHKPACLRPPRRAGKATRASHWLQTGVHWSLAFDLGRDLLAPTSHHH
jgi:hypothetical protein